MMARSPQVWIFSPWSQSWLEALVHVLLLQGKCVTDQHLSVRHQEQKLCLKCVNAPYILLSQNPKTQPQNQN